MRRYLRTTILAVLVSSTSAATRADAHAFLDHAAPKVGSTVASPPSQVDLVFTEGIEPAFSRVEVTTRAGLTVEAKALEHPESNELVLPLSVLAPGDYVVHWKVVSVDTHVTEGSFRFHVSSP